MTLNLSPVAPVTLAAVLLAQGSPSPRQLFALARPLEPSEIAIVLKSVQVALDGKTFRLPGNGSDSGTRVRMRAGGQARIIQMTYAVWHGVVDGVVSGAKTPPPSSSVWREEITTILDYPGLPAQRCNGTVEQGDMVIEYTSRGTGEWTVMARAENLLDSNITGAFSMLRSDEHLSSAERRQIDGKWARAIVSPWAESLNKSAGAAVPDVQA
jgi:hypothetical protein